MKKTLCALAALAGIATSAQAIEYDGRCVLFHDGKTTFDGKCHIALGLEGAAGKVWRYLLTPASGATIELRMWTAAYTINGVPAMQIDSPDEGPFHYVTAEGDDLRFLRPPKRKGKEL